MINDYKSSWKGFLTTWGCPLYFTFQPDFKLKSMTSLISLLEGVTSLSISVSSWETGIPSLSRAPPWPWHMDPILARLPQDCVLTPPPSSSCTSSPSPPFAWFLLLSTATYSSFLLSMITHSEPRIFHSSPGPDFCCQMSWVLLLFYSADSLLHF